MYRRIFLAKDGVTKLRESIHYGMPPSVGDRVGVKVGHRYTTGHVTEVRPVRDGNVSHEVEIVER